MIRVHFTFFGVEVEVLTFSAADERYLRFFFRRFVDEDADAGRLPEVTVELSAQHRDGFFASLLEKDGAPKTIRVSAPDTDETIRFRNWSGAPSPLPPFAWGRLAQRVAVMPGAALVNPAGKLVLLLGGTHAGKTHVELELLSAGWRTMADHLIVWDLEAGVVLPYLTPVGIRGADLERWCPVLDRVTTFETVSEVTGRVVLVDVDDLVPNCGWTSPLAPSGAVHLASEGGVAKGVRSCLRVFPRRRHDAIERLLPGPVAPVLDAQQIRREFEGR